MGEGVMDMSTSKRGFGSMDPERVKECASMGGKAAHAKGVAHKWKKGEEGAIEAGRKGGKAPHRSRGPKPQEGKEVVATDEA